MLPPCAPKGTRADRMGVHRPTAFLPPMPALSGRNYQSSPLAPLPLGLPFGHLSSLHTLVALTAPGQSPAASHGFSGFLTVPLSLVPLPRAQPHSAVIRTARASSHLQAEAQAEEILPPPTPGQPTPALEVRSRSCHLRPPCPGSTFPQPPP